MEHVVCIWRKRAIHIGFLWSNMKERDDLQDLGVGKRTILKWIFHKQVRRAWPGLNESSSSIKWVKFLDRSCWHSKNHSALWV